MAEEKNKRGFLGNISGAIKGAIFEEEAGASVGTSAQGTPPTAVPKNFISPVSNPRVESSGGKVDEQYKAEILAEVDRSTTDSYRRFQAQLEALRIIPDQQQRFNAALATSKSAFQIDPEDLLGCIKTRSEALDQIMRQFKDELQEVKKQELSSLDGDIEVLSDKIAEMLKGLKVLETERTEAQSKRKFVMEKFDDHERRFQSTYKEVADTINAEHQFINNNLRER